MASAIFPTGIPADLPSSLRIISLNCWGLKYISKHRNARLSHIGHLLATASPTPDIVGLQECWTQEDFQSIVSQTSHILPHAKFYHSGFFGSGLAILSRFPFESSSMHAYPLNGRPAAFFRGDWYVGKGVASARLRMGPGKKDVVEVLCTHLHAPYEPEWKDSYLCHRTAQAWEMSKLMARAGETGALVVGMGDFNMVPSSLAWKLVTGKGRVRDVWREIWPDSAIGASHSKAEKARGRKVPTAEEAVRVNGTTCDSRYNTWRWDKQLQKDLDKGKEIEVSDGEEDPNSQRLDYVFVGGDDDGEAGRWKVKDVNVGMMERHPDLRCSLSDHFSVETTVVRTEKQDVSHPGKANRQAVPNEIYEEIMTMIRDYEEREKKQGRLRMVHFESEVIIAIGCLTAIWWSPRNYVSFLLMLLSTVGLSAGVLDGLMGGLFVRSEWRALKEFEWEIMNARRLADTANG